jgi:p-aminobenzoyl-glutamate transporter AbgT
MSSIAFSITCFTHSSKPFSKYCFGTQIFIQEKSLVSHIFGSIISFQEIEVFSFLSSQFIISYNNPASFTVFVRVQGVSKLEAIAFTQYLEFLP